MFEICNTKSAQVVITRVCAWVSASVYCNMHLYLFDVKESLLCPLNIVYDIYLMSFTLSLS